MRSRNFLFLYSLFTAIAYNLFFWKKVVFSLTWQVSDIFLFTTFFLIVFTIFFSFFSLIFSKYTLKPLAIFFIVCNTAAFYFVSQYGIAIDKSMIVNSLQTDAKEVKDLLHYKMLIYFVIFALVPSLFIIRTKIIYQNFKKEVLQRIAVCTLVFFVTMILVVFQYRQVATFVRESRPTLGYLIPNNYITSTIKVIKSNFVEDKKITPIGEDAYLQNKNSKTLVILIIGETARAANFSFYGYGRNTNPLLAKDNVTVLKNSTSCGTSTAASVPCLFSHLAREEFVDENKNYQPLTSFIAKQKIDVLWRGNNSGGCKGICTDVPTEYFMNNKDKEFCLDDGCYDGIMLGGLADYIKKHQNNNTFIVLHQNGSHGPRYNHRYPKQFEIYKPVCDSADVSKCSKEELINAYDNTIIYNDYFLHEVIKIAKENSKIPTVMIYASDHGESLGEHGIYLHGFPYKFAPAEQKTIPFIIWASDNFKKQNKLNDSCFGKKPSYSHDNIFHSVLGAFGVKTKIYDKNLDIFSDCK